LDWQRETAFRNFLRRFKRFMDELFVALQFFNGSFREQREGNGAASRRNFGGGERIAYDGGGLLQTELPVGLAGIAKEQTVEVASIKE
jgi:hypothetical protein